MRLYILPALFLFISCQSNTRENNKQDTDSKTNTTEYQQFPYNTDTFNWKNIEKQNDSLITRFISSPQADFKNEYDAYNTAFSNLNDLKKALHVIDINGDGKDDLIFEGYSGGEPTELAFILNTNKGFKKIFFDFQLLKKAVFKNNKLIKIYVQDPGCCAAYIEFNKIYDVTYVNNIPKFKLSYLSANHTSNYFPKKYFKEPVLFEVLNEAYKLRTAPVIDDTTQMTLGGDYHPGNTLAELKKGTKGFAFASDTDKTGRIWWLVEIEPLSKLSKSVFYEQEDSTRRSAKIGWISNRYIKQLN